MRAVHDSIGTTYARSRRADLALVRSLAENLQLSSSGTYLDLACGTGNYTVALSSLGGIWSAADVSGTMLAQARAGSDAIAWVQAEADRLPFARSAFDGVICTLAIQEYLAPSRHNTPVKLVTMPISRRGLTADAPLDRTHSGRLRPLGRPIVSDVNGRPSHPNLARMWRTIVPAVAVCTLTSLAGCAMHETYGDRTLPEEERAVIEGYARYLLLYFEDLQIVSVDGKLEGGENRWAYASSVSLPAGRHWLQISILRNNSSIAMCAFEWTFEAKHHYKLRRVDHEQVLLAHPSSPRFPASISMNVTSPSMPTQRLRVRAECGKAAHCRQTSDCAAGYACQMHAGFEFGTCELHAR